MRLKNLIPPSWRDWLAWRLSHRELTRLMQAQDLPGIVRATFQYRGAGVFRDIYALQKEPEILDLTRVVRDLQPKITVEIGTAKGGTLYIWTRSNPQLELVVSIDLPGGNFGGGYDSRRERLYRGFAQDRPATEMVLLRCDSHADSTLTLLRQHLGARKIDFLWIDGDHSYDGAKRDFLTYSQLVRPGGLVAFHDVVTEGDGHEVYRLWNELKAKYPAREFIADRASKLMGIGVLTL